MAKILVGSERQLAGRFEALSSQLDVTAHVGADDVDIVGPTGQVGHTRKRFGERSIDYRHYVRELARKPQAVRQVASELTRDLGPPFDAAWRSLVDAHGPKQAARIFAKVLSHIERRGVEAVAATVSTAPSDAVRFVHPGDPRALGSCLTAASPPSAGGATPSVSRTDGSSHLQPADLIEHTGRSWPRP